MADTPASAWRLTLKRRLVITAAVLGLWSAGIQLRLIYLQVVRHDYLVRRADRQQSHTRDVPAARGSIIDRNGRFLARSVDAQTITANPTEVHDPQGTMQAICRVLGDCTAEDRSDMVDRLGRPKQFVYLRRQVTPDLAQKVAELKLPGVGFLAESRRYYPNNELAAQLLGFVNVDHDGLSGLESAYDALIRGRDGKVFVKTDAHNDAFLNRMERAPTAGATLELTIDGNIQYIVERELRAGVIENRAQGGAAVVLDPYTGEILAIANYPTFNPNAPKNASADVKRNRAVLDLYEPGSTFKIVTASAALEQHVVRPEDEIDVSGGQIRFGSDVIHDTHDYHRLSFTQVIVKSSNVGAIKVGLRLGGERLGEYIKRFGFGRQCSPRDFPGESAGIVHDMATLKDPALARVSMGYQIGVTPLQMAAAVSSIANGGELIQPRVIRAVVKDGVRRMVPKVVVNRTVTPEVATQVTRIMEAVVAEGTGKPAEIDGYTIAGKTGTAKRLVNRRYSDTEYNASFVGFVPSRKPVYTIVVVTESPHGPNGYYGGPVSAPVFRRISEALIRIGGVPPTLNAPPPVLVKRQPEGTGEVQTAGPAKRPVVLPPGTGDGVFPDVTGSNARDALMTLARLGVTPKLRGSGVVIVDQRPAAGTPIETGAVVTLWLARQPALLRAEATIAQ